MRTLKTLLIGGAAAAALVFGATALAKTAAQMHEMDVALPNGAIAQIHYSGEKPTVTLSQRRRAEPWLGVWDDPLWPAFDTEPLAIPDFSEITARMDRQLAAMRADMARFDQLAANPALTQNAGGSSAATRFCARSVEITQTGANAPQVVERSYGNCGQREGAREAQPSSSHAATHT